MAEEPKAEKISLEELMVSTLAMTDATVKLLIAKGVFTDDEFKAQLSTERANYLAVLKRLQWPYVDGLLFLGTRLARASVKPAAGLR
jgi:hypothetical protein